MMKLEGGGAPWLIPVPRAGVAYSPKLDQVQAPGYRYILRHSIPVYEFR